MTSGYFRYVNAVILTYACTDIETLLSIRERWIDNCTDYCMKNVMYFVVGTKIDEPENQFGEEKLIAHLESSKIHVDGFYRISSKTGENFDECIDSMIDKWLEKAVDRAPQRQNDGLLQRHPEEKSQHKCNCG